MINAFDLFGINAIFIYCQQINTIYIYNIPITFSNTTICNIKTHILL